MIKLAFCRTRTSSIDMFVEVIDRITTIRGKRGRIKFDSLVSDSLNRETKLSFTFETKRSNAIL